jgi:hypothetical protein
MELRDLILFDALSTHFITYITLDAEDISNGYADLPGYAPTPADASNIALNVIGGPTQLYGVDYIVQTGTVYWKGYALEPLISAGDSLRVTYGGQLQRRMLNTLILHSHYSNLNVDRMVVVSPSGSDSTVLGGDGTNTGGNGTWNLPYRTVQMALSNSIPGDFIVMRAGEYPLSVRTDGTTRTGYLPGLDGRVLVPTIDRTSVSDKDQRYFIEDFFIPKDFRGYGRITQDEIPWTFTYTGRSGVTSNAGYLSLTYDGTNQPWATSTFDMSGNFEVSADLRNVIDPLTFMVSGRDDTVSMTYDSTRVDTRVHTGGRDYHCWGTVNVPDASREQLVIEHIALSAEDIRNKYVSLSFIPDDQDSTSLAVNVVGGVPQNYGTDFIVQDGRVIWDGLALDGDLDSEDVLRVIYRDRRVWGPVRSRISFDGDILKVDVYDTGWQTYMRRNMVGDSTSWKVSFTMSDPDVMVNHNNEAGRGFVSNFLAVADSFTNSLLIQPYNVRTEKRTVVFYKDWT